MNWKTLWFLIVQNASGQSEVTLRAKHFGSSRWSSELNTVGLERPWRRGFWLILGRSRWFFLMGVILWQTWESCKTANDIFLWWRGLPKHLICCCSATRLSRSHSGLSGKDPGATPGQDSSFETILRTSTRWRLSGNSNKQHDGQMGQTVVVKSGWWGFPLGSLKSQNVLLNLLLRLLDSQPAHSCQRASSWDSWPACAAVASWHHRLFHFNDAGYLENDDVILRRRERASVAINELVPWPVVRWRLFTCCLTVSQRCCAMQGVAFWVVGRSGHFDFDLQQRFSTQQLKGAVLTELSILGKNEFLEFSWNLGF